MTATATEAKPEVKCTGITLELTFSERVMIISALERTAAELGFDAADSETRGNDRLALALRRIATDCDALRARVEG